MYIRNVRRLTTLEVAAIHAEASNTHRNTKQRFGQAFFNLLPADVATAIVNTNCDPFHDDTKVAAAINAILVGGVKG
jgi:hypothetical protein